MSLAPLTKPDISYDTPKVLVMDMKKRRLLTP